MLASQYERASSWADPVLPTMLGIGRTPPVSPYSSLQALLQDHPEPESAFPGFGPLLVPSDEPALTTFTASARPLSIVAAAHG